MSLAGAAMVIVGIIMFFASPLLLVPAIGGAVNAIGNETTTVRPGETKQTIVTQDQIGTWSLWLYEDIPPAVDSEKIIKNVNVEGPSGDVYVRATPRPARVSGRDVRIVVGEYEAARPGEYTIENNSEQFLAIVGANKGSVNGIATWGFAALLVAGLGILSSIVGFILGIVGLLWQKEKQPTSATVENYKDK